MPECCWASHPPSPTRPSFFPSSARAHPDTSSGHPAGPPSHGPCPGGGDQGHPNHQCEEVTDMATILELQELETSTEGSELPVSTASWHC
ncbi:class III lanthipeptide [Streptomyces cucumeris]|uniref:class III lanthipeptide n=1 Tax=Streptomyces cucumeris TaxID=2962890 RepID=UPI003EBBDAA2